MNKKGFTLLELVAVLIIMSVLAAAAVPKFIDLTKGAEKKLVELILADFNSQELMAYHNSLLAESEYECPIESGVRSSGVEIRKINDFRVKLITANGIYDAYRWETDSSAVWKLEKQKGKDKPKKGKKEHPHGGPPGLDIAPGQNK